MVRTFTETRSRDGGRGQGAESTRGESCDLERASQSQSPGYPARADAFRGPSVDGGVCPADGRWPCCCSGVRLWREAPTVMLQPCRNVSPSTPKRAVSSLSSAPRQWPRVYEHTHGAKPHLWQLTPSEAWAAEGLPRTWTAPATLPPLCTRRDCPV